MADARPSLDEIFSQPAPQGGRPSLDEIFSQPQQPANLPPGLESSNALESSLRGGLNMVTGGYMPNIAGALEHPIGAAKSLQGLSGQDVSQDPDVQKYTQLRDQYKNLYSQAEQEHPYAYGGGALASAFVAPTAIAETLPGRLAQATALGSAYATGGGTSDLAKGQIGEFGKEAGIGGLLGLGGGVALHGLGMAAGGLNNKLAENSEIYQKLLNAFSRGQEGKSIIGPQAQKEVGEELGNVSSDLANKLLTIRKQASDRIGDVVADINELPTGNIMSDIGNNITQSVHQTPTLSLDSDFSKFHSLYKKYLPVLGNKVVESTEKVAGDVLNNAGEPLSNQLTSQSIEQAIVSGADLNNFKVDLNQLLGKTKDQGTRDLIKSALGKIEETFAINPEYQLANQDLKRLSSQFPEVFLNKWVSKYAPGKAQETIENKVQKALVSGNKTGFNLSKVGANEKLDTLMQNFQQEELQNPGFLKNIGIDNLDDYFNKLKSTGQTFETVSKVAAQNKQSGISPTELLKGSVGALNPLGYGAKTGLGKAYLTANRLGKASNIGQKVFGMPNNALNSVIPILKGAGLDNYANMLQRGLDEGGQVKNSALFILLQQPQTRDILEKHSEGLENSLEVK